MVTRHVSVWLMFLSLVLASFALAGEVEEYYYAIEQNDVINGYAHVVIQRTECDGRPCLKLQDSIWSQMSALGKSFEGAYRFEYWIDPEDGMFFYHSSDIEQAATKLGATMTVVGDSMLIISEPDKDTSMVAVPSNTIRPNTRLHRYLVTYFVDDTLTRKECRVFSVVDGTINDVVYTNLGREKLDLAGKTYDALIVNSLDRTIGIEVRMWIDAATGLLLKTHHPIRSVYLTDAGVKDRIKRADLDAHLFARVDTVITNPWAISYMKVRARLQPGGMWMTSENLNIRGQRFEGTVQDNRIDGVFEISRDRYDGSGAPSFPCDFSNEEDLQAYLEPSDLIESDEPVLIEKAREITDGSSDAWEAATRLSRWVNDNIDYDIPGGGTALKTYETRLGECGSHSNLLAALCRAAGIPARCIFGCMYVPDHGGAFGQHAWNEIYMGDAGWIPVDCTVDEITYADCGHIRLAEWTSLTSMLNPEEMEILEFAVGEGTYADLREGKSTDYGAYIGDYQGPDKVLSILVHNGRLAIDIPGKMVFELKDPDENGDWYFVLTEAASVSFDVDESGTATALTINSRQRLPKEATPDTAIGDTDTPGEYRRLLGAYVVPMQNVNLNVRVEEGQLVLVFPGSRGIVLEPSDREGQWLGDTGESKLAVSFEDGSAGEVTAMQLGELVTCPKIIGASGP